MLQNGKLGVNSFPKKILDISKYKATADEKLNMILKNGIYLGKYTGLTLDKVKMLLGFKPPAKNCLFST